jgi:hypothetical protein
LGGAAQHLMCVRAAYDKKEQTPLPPAFVRIECWTHPLDLLGGSFGV